MDKILKRYDDDIDDERLNIFLLSDKRRNARCNVGGIVCSILHDNRYKTVGSKALTFSHLLFINVDYCKLSNG